MRATGGGKAIISWSPPGIEEKVSSHGQTRNIHRSSDTPLLEPRFTGAASVPQLSPCLSPFGRGKPMARLTFSKPWTKWLEYGRAERARMTPSLVHRDGSQKPSPCVGLAHGRGDRRAWRSLWQTGGNRYERMSPPSPRVGSFLCRTLPVPAPSSAARSVLSFAGSTLPCAGGDRLHGRRELPVFTCVRRSQPSQSAHQSIYAHHRKCSGRTRPVGVRLRPPRSPAASADASSGSRRRFRPKNQRSGRQSSARRGFSERAPCVSRNAASLSGNFGEIEQFHQARILEARASPRSPTLSPSPPPVSTASNAAHAEPPPSPSVRTGISAKAPRT
eukprot:gnl/Chilomastix_cuspidata/3778.p1 GENE.gnl/Chilomastix_cuspidata/3778~~gnl/Chilomastix_cuspidata/3778.p1  ORF type:complete len:332 (+),score=-43.37 gnl/Chilomastix_cuspidata/3778:395-1390(+)